MANNNAVVGQAVVGQAQTGNSGDTVIRRRYVPVKHSVYFAPVSMDGSEILRNGKNTYLDWDLVPNPVPTVPEPDDATPTVTIPGAIYVPELRLTGATGGFSIFGMRAGTWTFRPRRTGLWTRRFSDIANYLNGRMLKIVLDDDKGYYYIGTVEAQTWDVGDMVSTVTFSYKFYPYKYELTDSLQPWLWDPFSFVNGVIRKYGNLAVNTSRELIVYGREMPVVPDFYPVTDHTGLNVTVGGVTYPLYAVKNGVKYDGINAGLTGYTVPDGTSYDPNTGRFTVSDIVITGDGTEATGTALTFAGTGTVSVAYRGGRL